MVLVDIKNLEWLSDVFVGQYCSFLACSPEKISKRNWSPTAHSADHDLPGCLWHFQSKLHAKRFHHFLGLHHPVVLFVQRVVYVSNERAVPITRILFSYKAERLRLQARLRSEPLYVLKNFQDTLSVQIFVPFIQILEEYVLVKFVHS